MLTNYALTVAFLTTAALIWRALLLDHPALLACIEKIPFVGGMLTCGFCAALWISLLGVVAHNPLAQYVSTLTPFLQLWIGWFVVGGGVLFLRNLIAVLIEGAAVLAHLHHSKHE